MQFRLYKVSGYEEAILSLRMSKGKFYSWEKAKEIQELVYVMTDNQGRINKHDQYAIKLNLVDSYDNPKITGNYVKDLQEFERLLGLTFNNAMGEFKHHTLMKYIDVAFFTEGLHRGAQDDLDAHAIAFNNRITRFSTRLAEISDTQLSEWYQDKAIPFFEAFKLINQQRIIQGKEEVKLPNGIEIDGNLFTKTPFGYVLEKYAQVPAKNGLAKDVQRGLMPLGLSSNAIWKTDLFNLRYVYKMRSKLTKANPELKLGMEQLADQIEEAIPVFGQYFRKELTDSGSWEHMNKVKTVTSEEFQEYKKLKQAHELRLTYDLPENL
ncbi:FAD-dependent thymidylate synthase [Cytobacillus praedii]|uniref:FAD-dependent thymidylate synthase n=1 Tax=Cytobacillus praedii TaxID=1742358 RepID=UPI002E1ABC4B|nr:FAD-dependent thymidylate synthase [Cytobacillus praedii]MED3571928.1 FAD-dependent thymidylate synthase [Cytobacillus praedii]